MRRVVRVLLYSVVWLHSSAFAVDTRSAFMHFLRGNYEDAARQFDIAFKSTRDIKFKRYYILSLIGSDQLTQALTELEGILKEDTFQPDGMWVEGRFYRAWIYQQKNKLEEAQQEFDVLSGSGPDKELNNYYLAKIKLLKKDYKGAADRLQSLIDSHHPVEHAARFYLAAALYQLALSDPTYLKGAQLHLDWILHNDPDPNVVPVVSALLEEVKHTGTMTKAAKEPFDLLAEVDAGLVLQAEVPDVIFGIDPWFTVTDMALRARMMGAGYFRFFQKRSHSFHVGYSANGTIHFSTTLYPYDILTHGPSLLYRTHFMAGSNPMEISVKTQLVDGQMDITRIKHFLLASATTVSAQIHYSRYSATGIDLGFAYEMYTSQVTNSDPVFVGKGFANRVIYAKDMSGMRFALNVKQYFFADSGFQASAVGGLQKKTAGNSLYERLCFYAGGDAWWPVRWQLTVGFQALVEYSMVGSSARGNEIYSDTHIIVKRPITTGATLAVDTNYRIRNSATTDYGMNDFGILLRLMYQY